MSAASCADHCLGDAVFSHAVAYNNHVARAPDAETEAARDAYHLFFGTGRTNVNA